MRLVMALVVILGMAGLAEGQQGQQGQLAKQFEARELEGKNGKKLLYRFFAPKSVAEGTKLPLVLFLHGAGERGDDNKAQLKHCVARFLKNQKKHPCFVIVPQCPKGDRWANLDWKAPVGGLKKKPTAPMGMALEVVDRIVKDYPVDPKRIYVSGLSMGGYGTWDALFRRPKLFAAGIPICGGADTATAPVMASIPQWVFHGGKDEVVPTRFSRAMVKALKQAEGTPKYTEYPGVGHNSWNKAYSEPELFSWLFSQKKQNKQKEK